MNWFRKGRHHLRATRFAVRRHHAVRFPWQTQGAGIPFSILMENLGVSFA